MFDVLMASLMLTFWVVMILWRIRIEVVYKRQIKALELVHYTAGELIKQGNYDDWTLAYDILEEYEKRVSHFFMLFNYSVWSFDSFYPELAEKLAKLQKGSY